MHGSALKPWAVVSLSALWAVTTISIAVPLDYAPAPSDNPLKGFVPYLGDRPGFPHSMEWDYTRLSEVMKGPQEFDWARFETKLQAAASRGHQFYARFYLEWPGRPTGVPRYLLEDGLTMRRWTNTNTEPWPPAVDYTPDFEDPRLRAALTNFIHAFGARYDGDPRLGFIGLGLLGTWGEWHNHPKNEWFASKTVQREVLDAYEAAFSKTRLVARYPAGQDDPRYADNSRRPVGYHDDSFAWATAETGRAQDDWFFAARLRRAGAGEKWRTQPVGGEVRPELWDCLFDDPSCTPEGQEFDRCVTAVKVSWLACEGLFLQSLDPEVKRRALLAAQRLGYELHVAQAVVSLAPPAGPLVVLLTVTNTGVAPFYYDWPVHLAARDADGNIAERWVTDWTLSGILPGDPATAWGTRLRVDHLSPGGYQLLLRAPNRLANGSPVRFANATQDQHAPGWLTIGQFTRSHPIASPAQAKSSMPPRILIEADLLRINNDPLPRLRLIDPVRRIQDRSAGATHEIRETRGDTVEWLRQQIDFPHNVRVSLVSGPGVLGFQEPGAAGLHPLESLRAQADAEVITAPSITTLSGRSSRIEIAEETTILTGIHPEALVQANDVPRDLPEDPYTSAVIPLGLVCEVHPVVAEDLQTVDLTLYATLAEFVGYDATPPHQQVQIWQRQQPIWIDPPAPRLRLREIHGEARIADGATLVLGSWPSEAEAEGSSPTEPGTKEASGSPRILLLITPTLLDEFGHPLRPRTVTPADPVQDRR